MKDREAEGRTALVTGAGGGIGSAVVGALIEAGARVVACDRDRPALERMADDVGTAASAASLRCEEIDVADAAAVDDLVRRVEGDWEAIDWGVNVAGIFVPATVLDTSIETWRELFRINVEGVFAVSRALARHMASRGAGAIVTVGSNAAFVPRHGMAAYGASKAAASLFTRTLGLELAPRGVRCNVVAPGSTRTPMQSRYQERAGGEASVVSGSLESFRTGIPLGRIAEPQDVAEAVLFLLSDRARHITMAELTLDGGGSLHP